MTSKLIVDFSLYVSYNTDNKNMHNRDKGLSVSQAIFIRKIVTLLFLPLFLLPILFNENFSDDASLSPGAMIVNSPLDIDYDSHRSSIAKVKTFIKAVSEDFASEIIRVESVHYLTERSFSSPTFDFLPFSDRAPPEIAV
jgi:hypothetical protein